ncbi:hypothetical protein TIFTF001_020755 [Ficus carica]|uniref:PB1-like domain-containing protein n=1 Tax=Ficus carica TaxID=3494 RepID=A0AA88AGC0_FICCA|nr:hypothetical protein TIFTF001_020755 [Ficus carica]
MKKSHLPSECITGEAFNKDGEMIYEGGMVDYIDRCSADYMSLLELQDWVEKLGYHVPVAFHYKPVVVFGMNAFEQLMTDQDVIKMAYEVDWVKRIQDSYITDIDEPLAVDTSQWLNYAGDNDAEDDGEAVDGESDDGKYAALQDDENLHDVQVDDEIMDSSMK